ncbi:MAG: type II secretion system F family protein [Alphaproteobacteria bacterium]|nr:type II secretion system F family protein [Alphaproteobacteria bacterium]
MTKYAYKALNAEGRTVRGQMSATGEQELYIQLQKSKLQLIECSVKRERRGSIPGLGGISLKDLIQLTMHLYQLSKVGVPLIHGLEDVRDSTKNAKLHNVVAEVHKRLGEGCSFSEALAEHPKVFDTVFVSLVAAGEQSGTLTETFLELIKHLKWTDAVNRKIKAAMFYPSIMLFFMVGLFVCMMTMVVPQVTGFLISNNQDLPFMTTSLIATSDFVRDQWIYLLIVPIVLFIGYKLLKRSESCAIVIDSLWLKIPVIGNIIQKISMARFSHFFAVMFKSAVPILKGLETSQKVISNRYLKDKLGRVREAVHQGEALSVAMENWGNFPSLVIRMMRIGEDSGSLADTLQAVTEFYDTEVSEAVDVLIRSIEPFLTVVCGAILGWVAVAVFGPLYDSISQIGGS